MRALSLTGARAIGGVQAIAKGPKAVERRIVRRLLGGGQEIGQETVLTAVHSLLDVPTRNSFDGGIWAAGQAARSYPGTSGSQKQG
jgi:hypothetical protein